MTTKYKKTFDQIKEEVHKVVVGQDEMIDQIIISLLGNGNALLEGYPGLAKTLTVNSLAKAMNLDFSRVQNTPDLMPSDITGTFIISEEKGKREFKFHKGPIFSNIVLADEINRATPRSQSAFLEAMQERQVTVGNSTFALDEPFFVLATQNPIEQEGTYPLPEAQSDRFLLKINASYPTEEEEMKILTRFTEKKTKSEIHKVLDKKSIKRLQELTREMPISDDLRKTAVKLIKATRTNTNIFMYGASPRATVSLIFASKAKALMEGRSYVKSQDMKEMCFPVLRHRVILSFDAERKGMTIDDALKKIVE